MNIEEMIDEEIIKLQRRLWQREGVPKEVFNTLEKIHEKLKEKNKEEGVDSSNINEYIDSQFEMFENIIIAKIGEERKSKKIEEIMYDKNILKQKLNYKSNEYIIQERKLSNNKEAMNNTAIILEQTNNLLENIYAQQRRILLYKGFDENFIENIRYKIKYFMQEYMRQKCENNIQQSFIIDNEKTIQLEEDVISKIIKIIEDNSTDKEKFQAELKKNVPDFYEQKEDANKRRYDNTEEGRSEENSLPGDVLK